MPTVTYTNIDFDPFIGMQSNNLIDPGDVEHHNNWVLRGTQAMQTINNGDTDGDVQRRRVRRLHVQALQRMQHYNFDSTLGREVAEAFSDTKTAADNDKALKRPSESVKIIYRVLRNRQKWAIRAFLSTASPSLSSEFSKTTSRCNRTCARTTLKSSRAASVTSLCAQAGSPRKRAKDKSEISCVPRGVLLTLSSTHDQLGANVASCDAMLIVGDLPYNNASLSQAVHRIRRLNQPVGTQIEVIKVFARRSITTAKMDMHEDKAQRLERGINDVDFRKFALCAGSALARQPQAHERRMH